jgi:uncharacterized protein YecE (DUF72 family)
LNVSNPPYFVGCPSWSENAWRESLYPPDARSSGFLELYAQVFNAVEGNTTFYASPKETTVALGAGSARAFPVHRQISW